MILAFLVLFAGGGHQKESDTCKHLGKELNRAYELTKNGERRKADDLYREVRDLAMAESCPLETARALNGLGFSAVREGSLIDGVTRLKEAEAILQAGDIPEDLVQKSRKLKMKIALGLGDIFFRLNWLNDANDAFRQTEVLYQRYGTEDVNWAKLHLGLARIYRSQGQEKRAIREIQKALSLDFDDAHLSAAIWQERARIELGSGDLDAVDRSIEKAVQAVAEVPDTLTRANVYADLAELRLRRGRWAEALESIDSTTELIAQSGASDFNLEAFIYHLRARAHHGLGDLRRSKREADMGLALMDEMRITWNVQGREYFARRQGYYRFRLDLAAASEDPEDALAVFEGYRARNLLAVLSRQSAGKVAPDIAEGVSRRRKSLLAAIRLLDQSEGKGEEIQERNERLFRSRRRDLREALAEQEESEGLPVQIGPKEAGELLDGETLGLIYARGTDRFHLIVLDSRQKLVTFKIDADPAWLADSVARLLAASAPLAVKGQDQESDRLGHDLGRLLLGPLGDRLDANRRLAIVAESSLEKLPFEALRHPRTGRLLIESHEVAYLPSFSVLGASRSRIGKTCSPPAAALLAVGDPVLGASDDRWPADIEDPRNNDESLIFDRLPSSASEVDSIAAIYSHGVTLAQGFGATRKRILEEAPKHRTIHVASHAWSDTKEPELSKIALSCIDSEGRVPETCDFYFADAATLNLCGQVVVLSACQTAEGPTVDGEGVLGLPRAFLHAGAASVVASLWPVADKPTAKLMLTFHEGLSRGHDPAEALRGAKLELLGEGAPPSVWAAFVLVGDWRLVNSSSTFSAASGPIDRIN